jgi:hypothetical protein
MQKDDNKHSDDQGFSTRTVEILVAAFILLISLVVIYDSRRVGASWVSDGPQAGYFPFYIGIILCVASGRILLQAFFSRRPNLEVFVNRTRFKLVLAVLIPASVFVAAIYFIGIYLSSALFIACFMWWQGKFGLTKILPVSILVPVIMFLLFEVWFLVPLPKGPVETLFGY